MALWIPPQQRRPRLPGSQKRGKRNKRPWMHLQDPPPKLPMYQSQELFPLRHPTRCHPAALYPATRTMRLPRQLERGSVLSDRRRQNGCIRHHSTALTTRPKPPISYSMHPAWDSSRIRCRARTSCSRTHSSGTAASRDARSGPDYTGGAGCTLGFGMRRACTD